MTRPTPAHPGAAVRDRPARPAPIPCTVWLCDHHLCDHLSDPGRCGLPGSCLDRVCPGVIASVVRSFSVADAPVGVLAWPRPDAPDTALDTALDTSLDTSTGAEPIDPAADHRHHHAVAAMIATAGRRPLLMADLTGPADPAATSPAQPPSQPSPWPRIPPTTVLRRPADPAPPGARGPGPGLDLVIAIARAGEVDDATAARAASAAAHALRHGGILVMLTHCDRVDGVLVDPGGIVVTAGQNTDLLYLQHVVAVHTPAATQPDTHPGGPPAVGQPDHGPETADPLPHRRVHSDVYVLAQQQDHHRSASCDPNGGDDQ